MIKPTRTKGHRDYSTGYKSIDLSIKSRPANEVRLGGLSVGFVGGIGGCVCSDEGVERGGALIELSTKPETDLWGLHNKKN